MEIGGGGEHKKRHLEKYQRKGGEKKWRNRRVKIIIYELFVIRKNVGRKDAKIVFFFLEVYRKKDGLGDEKASE